MPGDKSYLSHMVRLGSFSSIQVSGFSFRFFMIFNFHYLSPSTLCLFPHNHIQNFWRYFNNVDSTLNRICGDRGRFTLRLFKSSISPVWEDPANKVGGKWVLLVLLFIIGQVSNVASSSAVDLETVYECLERLTIANSFEYMLALCSFQHLFVFMIPSIF